MVLGETLMFKHLARYDVILVSGPQRSGTRIAAKMIAADTGHRYVDEGTFEVYDHDLFRAVIRQMHRIVVHCPSMSHLLHKVGADNVLVVWMLRNLEDIVASERRVNWSIGPYAELARLGLADLPAIRYRRHGGQVAPLKYARWWGYQRERVQHWLELKYESLAAHPLWVPKEQRSDFATKQTEIG